MHSTGSIKRTAKIGTKESDLKVVFYYNGFEKLLQKWKILELKTALDDVCIIRKHVKNITLKVKPTCEVILTVPLLTTDEHIRYILNKKKSWIDKKVTFCKENHKPQTKEYVSGDNVEYLGKSYRLKIIQSQDEYVKLEGEYIQIFTKDKDDLERKKRLLNEWYLSKSEAYFREYIIRYSSLMNVSVKRVKIRKMKTRWGSCNSFKSYINLNSELIKKHTDAIEYVVLHELAHLIHPNHSKDFYDYLSIYMPDWKKRKEKLI